MTTKKQSRLRCRYYDWRANLGLVPMRYCGKPATGCVRLRRSPKHRWGRARLTCVQHWNHDHWLPVLAKDEDGAPTRKVLGWYEQLLVPLSEYKPMMDPWRNRR